MGVLIEYCKEHKFGITHLEIIDVLHSQCKNL